MVGRLGNQMFMVANCLSQSLTYNKQMILYKSQLFDPESYLKTIFRKLEFSIDPLPTNVRIVSAPYEYIEVKPFEESITMYEGYYQSEKNFKQFSNVIKWLYEPPSELVSQFILEYPELNSNNVTCINVRRGDYLLNPTTHPVITKEYIEKAASLIKDTDFYFVISDDIQWCRENINFPNCKFIEYSTWKALWLMSLCKNFIISNSSFSWWGAYLSKYTQKQVVAPKTWCGPTGPQNTIDVICDGWIALDTFYEDGKIYPI